jgi:hypothetical protein
MKKIKAKLTSRENLLGLLILGIDLIMIITFK